MAPTSDQQHAINEVSQALQHKARFIYWDDGSHCFAYFRYQDNNKFKQFIKKHETLSEGCKWRDTGNRNRSTI